MYKDEIWIDVDVEVEGNVEVALIASKYDAYLAFSNHMLLLIYTRFQDGYPVYSELVHRLEKLRSIYI